MSFHITAPCFLTFYRSDQSLLPFKFKIFVLNTSLIMLCLQVIMPQMFYGIISTLH